MGVTRVSNTPDPSGKPRLERALTDSSKGRPTGTLRRPNSHALVVRKNAEPEGSSVRSVSAPIIYMREHVIASSGAEDVPQRSPSPKTPPAQSPQNSQFGTAPNKDATLVMPRKMPSSPPRPSTFFNNPVLLTSRSAFSSKRLEFSPPDAARKRALEAEKQRQSRTTATSAAKIKMQNDKEERAAASAGIIYLKAEVKDPQPTQSLPLNREASCAACKHEASTGQLFLEADKLINDLDKQTLDKLYARFNDQNLLVKYLESNPQRIQAVLLAVKFNTERLSEGWIHALIRACAQIHALNASCLSDEELASCLRFFPNLQVLKLHKCTISQKAALELCKLTKLTSLTLSVCTLTNQELTLVLSSFEPARLKHLKVTWCPMLSVASLLPLASMSGLETLNLNGFQSLTDEAFDFFVPHRNLKELQIGCCVLVSSKGLEKLIPAGQNLVLLNLTDCKALFKQGLHLLSQFSALQVLILRRYDNIGHAGAFPQLSTLQHLRHLDISSSFITPTIAENLLRISSLKVIDIRSTKGIFSSFIEAAKVSQKRLIQGERIQQPIHSHGPQKTHNPKKNPDPLYKSDSKS